MEEERRAVIGERGPGVAGASIFAARALGHARGDRVGPGPAAIARDLPDEPTRAAVGPAVLLMADQEPRDVRRIDCDPRLDCGVGIENAAVGGLLLVHVVLGAGSERIGAGHLHERAEALRQGG